MYKAIYFLLMIISVASFAEDKNIELPQNANSEEIEHVINEAVKLPPSADTLATPGIGFERLPCSCSRQNPHVHLRVYE